MLAMFLVLQATGVDLVSAAGSLGVALFAIPFVVVPLAAVAVMGAVPLIIPTPFVVLATPLTAIPAAAGLAFAAG